MLIEYDPFLEELLNFMRFVTSDQLTTGTSASPWWAAITGITLVVVVPGLITWVYSDWVIYKKA